jgi:hypothetical protein
VGDKPEFPFPLLFTHDEILLQVTKEDLAKGLEQAAKLYEQARIVLASDKDLQNLSKFSDIIKAKQAEASVATHFLRAPDPSSPINWSWCSDTSAQDGFVKYIRSNKLFEITCRKCLEVLRLTPGVQPWPDGCPACSCDLASTSFGELVCLSCDVPLLRMPDFSNL